MDILTSRGVVYVDPSELATEKFGRNPDIGTTTEDIWDVGGDYNWMTVSQKLSIASSSGLDTDGGTGGQELTIQGLDENHLVQEEKVILNGTTPVVTLNDWYRVNRMYVSKVGSTQYNQGTIDCTAVTDAFIVSRIRPLIGQTNQAIFTLPINMDGYLLKLFASINRASGSTAVAAEVDLYHRNGGAWRSIHPFGLHNYGGPAAYEFLVCPYFHPGTDFKMSASASASADITGGMAGVALPLKNVYNPEPPV
jgi:hypothetical protein